MCITYVKYKFQIRNDAPLEETIATIQATDTDGTPPGNIVRYRIDEQGSSEKAAMYFRIHPESGEIIVADDLTKEVYDEYRVSLDLQG